jgi:hypothetical protein
MLRPKRWMLVTGGTGLALLFGAAYLYLTAPSAPPHVTLRPDDPAVVADV